MQSYETIIKALEMMEDGYSTREIHEMLHIGGSTLSLIKERFELLGMTLNDFKDLPSSKAIDAIYQKTRTRDKDKPLPDYQKIYDRRRVGKTTLACALGISAIQNGHPVFYQKASFLVQELVDAINDLTIKDKVTYYDKFDLMIIDDFGMMDRDLKFARGVFELLDHREAVRSVIVLSQLPFTNWYDTIKDATYADAVLDRLFGNSYKLEMSGDSKRHLR